MVKRSGGSQRWMVAVVAFVVSAAATVLAAVSSSPDPSARAAEPAPTASASAKGTGEGRQLRIGVAFGDTLTWKSDKELAAGLDDVVRLGAKWVRVDLSWNNIQPDIPTRYEWHRFDRIAQAARARHLNVLATIAYTPAWARRADCRASQSCAPADPATFAAFASAAVTRYAPLGVHTWEIWNEPNIPFWQPEPDPVGYTRLLRVTTARMRAADPRAYLLLGGLAAVRTGQKPGWMSQTDFLTAVSRLGANRLVDAVGYHPYNYPRLPSATTGTGTAFERISTARENLVAVLDRYGTPDLPVWLTETGAPTNGPGAASDGTTIPPDTTHVTEAFQARIATDTIPTAAANPHVGAVFWFAAQDSGTDKEKEYHSRFYGLRRYDGTAKPAFTAFKDAVAAYLRSRK